MILNKLTLTNLGVYRGRHQFNLRPNGKGPIVIVGGKNGAGKTTLLEAVRLCLYGPHSLDDQMLRPAKSEDYKEYLRSRIHRYANGVLPLNWASVELEFEYAIAGERFTYTVERSWKVNDKGVDEVLCVRQSPEPPEEMDSQQWEDFIRQLVPPALAQLFILDGEKIQTLASGSQDIQQAILSNAMKSLLGLDLVEQLNSDLTVYRRQQQRGNRLDAAQQRIEGLENELTDLGTIEETLKSQLSAIDCAIEATETRISLQKAEIARVGGGFARQRNEQEDAKIRLRADIEHIEQEIRDMCAGLLPFAITPAYTAAVKTQLLREAEYERWLASKRFIEQKLDEVREEVASEAFWQDTGADILFDFRQTVGQKVAQTLQRLVEPPEHVRDVDIRHHASEPERAQLLAWIHESQTRVPLEISSLTSKLAQLRKELADVELALQRVPEDDVLAPFIKALNEKNQELGSLAQKRLQKENELRKLKIQQIDTESKLHRARQDRTARLRLAKKIKRAMDVQSVLGDFTTKLTELRVSQLEGAFTQRFNQLCRKERLLGRAIVDREDFSVSLISTGGEQIAQEELSAGEKHIYAVALLWALRHVSGRPLPVIMDAPLGRLDSEHRRHLVERYFPQVSHQVILCSTDVEIDSEAYAMLQEYTSHAYLLEYDQAKRATLVSTGYFWCSDGRKSQ